MQHSFLKNLNKLLLFFLLIFSSACVVDSITAKLPQREARWAQIIEAQYPSWKRPIIKIDSNQLLPVQVEANNTLSTLGLSTLGVYREPPPINQAQFIPDYVKNSGNFNTPQPQIINKADVNSSNRYYTVKKGDVLSSIAYKFYGKSHYWKKIYDVNLHILKSPNSVKVGQKLLIP